MIISLQRTVLYVRNVQYPYITVYSNMYSKVRVDWICSRVQPAFQDVERLVPRLSA